MQILWLRLACIGKINAENAPNTFFSINMALKLIAQLLETRGGTESVSKFEDFYIGINALLIMLDPESNFTIGNNNLQQILNEASYGFESCLPSIIFACDTSVGVAVLGKSNFVLEAISIAPKSKEEVGDKDELLAHLSQGVEDSSDSLDLLSHSRSRSDSVELNSLQRDTTVEDLNSAFGALGRDVDDKVDAALRGWHAKSSREKSRV